MDKPTNDVCIFVCFAFYRNDLGTFVQSQHILVCFVRDQRRDSSATVLFDLVPWTHDFHQQCPLWCPHDLR